MSSYSVKFYQNPSFTCMSNYVIYIILEKQLSLINDVIIMIIILSYFICFFIHFETLASQNIRMLSNGYH